MAKKLFQVSFKKVISLYQENLTNFNKLLKDKKYLELNKLFGKAYYLLEIKNFTHYFKMDKDIEYELKTIENFNSKNFIEDIAKRLNFSFFELQNIPTKDFFFAFLNLIKELDQELFSYFLQKLFLHYHHSFKTSSNVNIKFQEMAVSLSKFKKINFKESFGEKDNQSYFKIIVDDKIIVSKNSNSIKTARKKAYKEFFYWLLDNN